MPDIPANPTTEATFEGDIDGLGRPLSGSYSGLLETSGDRDWIELNLNGSGFRYDLRLNHLSPMDGTGDQLVLTILDPTGVPISSVTSGNILSFIPPASGRYFVMVSSPMNIPAEYTVSVARGAGSQYGTNGNDTLVGGPTMTLSGVLFGGLGNDNMTLTGIGKLFGEAGSDTLIGSHVDAGIDTIADRLFGGPGADYIFGYVGADRLEGGSDDDRLFGGVGNDVMLGGTGSDTLNGDADADRMAGESGDDTYVVDNAGDIVSEHLASGNDLVNSLISFSLANAAVVFGNVERLSLVDVAPALNATGNALNNVLTGNSFNNILTGGGGTDMLVGGLGDDTYVLENGSDTVSDSGGIDRVTSTISRSLAVGGLVNVDILNLVDVATALNGTGNALSNAIGGNSFANILDGGAGNDALRGLAGNDTLVGGVGIDTLIGGTGRDLMNGGADNDIFRFQSTADSLVANPDLITDFDDSGDDRIDVSALFGTTMTYRHNLTFSAAGQVRINDIAGADVLVEVNTSGTSGAELVIRLTSTTLASMTGSDFVL